MLFSECHTYVEHWRKDWTLSARRSWWCIMTLRNGIQLRKTRFSSTVRPYINYRRTGAVKNKSTQIWSTWCINSKKQGQFHIHLELEADNKRMNKTCGSWKVKVWFYIALYPVRWTAQSALHFPPLADLFIPTPFSASLGSILAMQQLRNDYSLTFPPLSIARYSFIQLSRLRRREVKENAQTSKR